MRGPVELISEGYAGIGWGQFQLRNFTTADEFYEHLDSTQQSVGRSGNQLRRFIEVKQGRSYEEMLKVVDYVVELQRPNS